MQLSRKYLVAAVTGVLLSASAVTGAQAADPSGATGQAPRYQPEMVAALAKTLGGSEQEAVDRLDHEASQQRELAAVNKQGIKTDGAFFTKAGTLTVNAPDARSAAQVEDAGLTARVPEHGKSALDRIKSELDAKAVKQVPVGVSSWSVDLASDTVTVEVSSDSGAAARSFIKAAGKHGDAVRVIRGQERLETQAVVPPGSRMTFNGYICSVGFGARDAAGKQYLVTAGHCIEDLPDLAYNNVKFAKGTNSRFAVGTRSVDMGIAAVDAEDSIGTQVTTYGQAGNVAVRGSTRASQGSAMCKSGQTTQWTCGTVGSYNVTVTYTDANGGPDTVVTGLGSSTVCTEGGDSGGAYISGNQAQGMTSGGPIGQNCTGVNTRGSSYFQPLTDALSYYKLTLNVS
ncbi:MULTISPECIES: S1 family peptidase [Streptomyces]|uniref:S1 family peptidase n=1 Tax=Streptomyces TaxID=1883 RepID=UPI00084C551D|nr:MULTISPECIES: S1 family peptidase [Streptomyces]TFI20921.1 S1 family peptidase [Streptomyces sp. 4R-3d]